MKHQTYPQYLMHNFGTMPDSVAIRKKKAGIWKSYTWRDCFNAVKDLSSGLVVQGLAHGESVVLLGDDGPEWFLADVAVQSVGGATVPLWSDCTPSQAAEVIRCSGAKYVFTEDQEQVEKLLSVKEQIPKVRMIVYWSDKGLSQGDDALLMRYEHLCEIGAQHDREHPGHFVKRIETGFSEAVVRIDYVHNPGGSYKGASLSSRAVIESSERMQRAIPLGKGDNIVSTLPGGSVCQLWLSGYCFMRGAVMNFPERPETLLNDYREISPQLLFLMPSQWEELAAFIRSRIDGTKGLKKIISDFFYAISEQVDKVRSEGQPLPVLVKALYLLGERVVFRRIRDKMGLRKTQHCLTGGGHFDSIYAHFFQLLGVDIKRMYFNAETGVVSMQSSNDCRRETVGAVCDGAIVTISSDGEILVSGDSLFSGYQVNADVTPSAPTKAFFNTGDAGHLDEHNQLTCLGRRSDLCTLNSGHQYAPEQVRDKLRFSPYVQNTFVGHCETTDRLTVLVEPDFMALAKWAEANDVAYSELFGLTQSEEAAELFREEIQRTNEKLAEHLWVKKFVVLSKGMETLIPSLMNAGCSGETDVYVSGKVLMKRINEMQDEVSVHCGDEPKEGQDRYAGLSLRVRAVSNM